MKTRIFSVWTSSFDPFWALERCSWILIILSFCIKPALAQGPVSGNGLWPETTVLETVNSFRAQWCCSNNGYLYGRNSRSASIVYRKTENGQNVETRGNVSLLNPAFKIEDKIFSATTPGLIFIPVMDSSVFFLLKSSDGGTTFKNVFTFGKGNGPSGKDAVNVRLLRGILELTRELPGGGGLGTLFIGEYNVGDARIPGSTNDRVRIMKSVDNGDTWTKIVEWNTNGTNQVGHIHAMKQDPYTGEIYICTGDSDNKAGIIKWDGKSPWPDNKRLSELNSVNGFKVLTGSQRFRACDVLFDSSYFYTFADTQTPNNPTGSESGIWRGAKDFSSFNRMDNTIFNYDPMHIGWFGEKIGNTFIFTTSREFTLENGWKQLNTLVYTSTNGVNWYASGVINWRETGDSSATRYIANVFSYNNRIYIDCFGGAGHSSTIQCELVRKWKTFEDPVILHPVYFVGNWNSNGNDSNTGSNPDAPKRTLTAALSSNSISAGARIRIAEGTYNETNIRPLWSTVPLQGRGSVVIEGQGITKTHIVGQAGPSGTFTIRIEASRTLTNNQTPLIFKNLEILMAANAQTDHSNNVFNIIDSYVKTIDCKIGDISNDNSPLIKLNTQGSKYISENSIHATGNTAGINKYIVSSEAPNTVYQFKNCEILNAYDAFEANQSGTQFSLENCTFYNIEHSGIIFGAAWNTQPVIKNCIFSCGSAPITDLSGITEDSIDYNLYNRQPQNVTDGGHNLPVGTDPLFVDPSKGNLNLKSDSPCKLKGIFLSDVLYDFNYLERKNPPCIGAFENTGDAIIKEFTVSPGEILIAQSIPASGTINIISNISWTAVVDSSWIKISLSSGTGNATITVSAISQNTSTSPRVGNVIISAEGMEPARIVITQSGALPELKISPAEINIASAGGETFEVFVNSNTDWKVSCQDVWLNLSSGSGTGNGSISVTTLSSNILTQARNTNLIFSAIGIVPVIVKVTQAADSLTLINKTKEKLLKIYPNPVKDNLVIEYSNDVYKTIKIVNYKGIIIAKEKVTAPVQHLDFSKYEPGLYILEFESQGSESERVKISH